MNKLRRIVMTVIVFACTAAPAFASDGTTVAPGATVSITGPDGVCRKVTNNNGSNSLYVANTSAGEWEDFIARPGTATLASCPPACAGLSSGGYCWFYGSKGQTCNDVCSAQGKACNLAALQVYGSGGSDAQCGALIQALSGLSGLTVDSDRTGSSGCGYVSPHYARRTSNTTTCEGYGHDTRRACACQ